MTTDPPVYSKGYTSVVVSAFCTWPCHNSAIGQRDGPVMATKSPLWMGLRSLPLGPASLQGSQRGGPTATQNRRRDHDQTSCAPPTSFVAAGLVGSVDRLSLMGRFAPAISSRDRRTGDY